MSQELPENDQINILNPKELTFTLTENPFSLSLNLISKVVYENIFAMPAFPLTASQELIHLYERSDDGGLGKLIGVIENANELSQANNAALQSLLKKVSHLPIITCITNILDEFHYFHWYVETDRGPADFFIGAPRRHITPFSPNALLVKDLKGDMYHILDQSKLDRKSQDFLNLTF